MCGPPRPINVPRIFAVSAIPWEFIAPRLNDEAGIDNMGGNRERAEWAVYLNADPMWFETLRSQAPEADELSQRISAGDAEVERQWRVRMPVGFLKD